MASKGKTHRSLLSPSSSTTSLDSLVKEKTLAADDDEEGQKKLKLFESPLAHKRATSTTNLSKPTSVTTICDPLEIAPQSHSRQSSIGNVYDDSADEDEEHKNDRISDAGMRETPEFRRYEETTNIELFYDLFFVANLTIFTDVHEINGSEALQAYAGFFCILWFLWCQVSLFDVRFVTDSILERIGKACQFGVMVGLAVVGPDFNATNQIQGTFRSLSIILMLSRIILGFQYLTILYHVWNYKSSKTPLTLVTTSNFVAALIYFATFFGFKSEDPTGKVFVVWYVTAVVETIVNVALSSQWKVLSFKGTHLVQRMSLLTLIILGEGIIGVAKRIATIVENEASWTAPLTATTTAAVAIIYFVYMIYFDWMNRKHFGSIRQEIWAFLHFPFHLALILLVEGTAQFIVWRKVVEVVRNVNQKFSVALAQFNGTSSVGLSLLLANVTNDVFDDFNPKFMHTLYDAQTELYNIGNGTFNSTEQIMDISTLFSIIQDSLFDNFGIDPPETNTTSAVDPNEEWSKNMNAFILVYVYFFVAAGSTLILMNILNFISRPNPTRGDRSRIAINAIVGMALAALSAIVNTEIGFDFAQSAWVLPVVAFTFIFVVTLGYTKLL